MIQYYIGKVIRELAYLLQPIFTGTASPYVVDFVPLEEKYEWLEQSNESLDLSTQGEVSGFDYQQFTANKITNINSEYALKKIDFDMTPFTDAVLAISPTDENGYSFLVVKNVIKSYFLSYKGQSKTYFTLVKGAAQRSVEFIVLRISPTELVFLGDTDGWLYEFYYDQERASGIYDLNNATRKFSNVPDVAYLNILNSSYGYFFRARGKDPDGNWTEWSTTYIDGTDAFYLPKYDQEVANEYMPELEKFTLTSDKFSIISYPNFEQGLRMAGIKYNGNNYFLRETDIDKIFATSPDDPIPMSRSTFEFARFNPRSPEYPAFLAELQTANLNVRAQLEWDVIDGIERPDLVLLIDTSNAGTPVGFTIPTTSGTYLYDVDWGDGITTTNHTGDATHTYASDGFYQVRITGTFPKTFFNNTGDRLKVIGILNWGQTGLSTNQFAAFFGLSNLTEIPTASDAWYNSITFANSMFRNAKLTDLPSNMTLDSLTNGERMFQVNDITSLPSGTTLGNLTNGSYMFFQTDLQSLPSSLTLASLVTGTGMFRNTLIASLPSGITLGNLTNGSYMFAYTNLQSLPNGMTLGNLTVGTFMFDSSNLQTLPSSMTLSSLTNGGSMFRNNSLTDLPSGITLANLVDGSNMFFGNTINTTRYSQLLIDMNANNSNNNVVFHGGTSKYNAAGQTARNALLARGWTITDGGLEI